VPKLTIQPKPPSGSDTRRPVPPAMATHLVWHPLLRSITRSVNRFLLIMRTVFGSVRTTGRRVVVDKAWSAMAPQIVPVVLSAVVSTGLSWIINVAVVQQRVTRIEQDITKLELARDSFNVMLNNLQTQTNNSLMQIEKDISKIQGYMEAEQMRRGLASDDHTENGY